MAYTTSSRSAVIAGYCVVMTYFDGDLLERMVRSQRLGDGHALERGYSRPCWLLSQSCECDKEGRNFVEEEGAVEARDAALPHSTTTALRFDADDRRPHPRLPRTHNSSSHQSQKNPMLFSEKHPFSHF